MLELSWANVVSWLLEHGTRILIILVLGVVLWFTLKKSLPPLLRRTMARHRQRESKESIKKRADTLLSVFLGVGKIFISAIWTGQSTMYLMVRLG